MAERRICGAKTRQNTICQRSPVRGRERCNLHGGKTPRGLDHPNTKHGRKSKDLPERLQPNLERAIHDEQLSSLQDEIVILDVLIKDVIDSLDRGESGAFWHRLKDLKKEYLRASVDDRVFVLEEILETIDAGASEAEKRTELTELMEKKGRLVGQEIKHLRDLNVLIPSDRVILMFNAYTDLTMRFITSEDDRRTVAAEARRLLNIGELRRVDRAS